MRFASCLAIILVSQPAVEGTSVSGMFGNFLGLKSKGSGQVTGKENEKSKIADHHLSVPAARSIARRWTCEKSTEGARVRFAKFTQIRRIRDQQRTVTFNGHFDCDVTDEELESLFDAGEEPETAEIGCHADHENAITIDKLAVERELSSQRKKKVFADNLVARSVFKKSRASRKKEGKALEEVTGDAAAIVTIFSPEGWSSAKREKLCGEAKKIHMTKNSWQCKLKVNNNGKRVIYSNKNLGDVVFFGMGECVNLPNNVKLDGLFSLDQPDPSAKSAKLHSESSTKSGKSHPPCEQDDDSSDAAVHCNSNETGTRYTAEIRPTKGVRLGATSSEGEDRCVSVIEIEKLLQTLVRDDTTIVDADEADDVDASIDESEAARLKN